MCAGQNFIHNVFWLLLLLPSSYFMVVLVVCVVLSLLFLPLPYVTYVTLPGARPQARRALGAR